MTLLADVAAPYTMHVGQTIRVIRNGHALTVNPPTGNYLVQAVDSDVTTGEGESAVTVTTTTYTVVAALAEFGGTLYASFAEAVSAAAPTDGVVTLLADVAAPYTMHVGQTIRVIRNGHALTVNPPAGGYVLRQNEIPAQDPVPAYTAYSLGVAVAVVNGAFYESFPAAVQAAGGADITLLANVPDAFTLSDNQTLRVILGGHTLTVTVPENYRLQTSTSGDVSIYSAIRLYAQVGDAKYESFASAVSAANGVQEITLLRDMDTEYSMSSDSYEILRIVKNGHTANVTNYAVTKDVSGVSYYYKTNASSAYSGSGFAYVLGGIFIAAGTAALVYYDQYAAEGAAGSVVLAEGASVTIEGGSCDVTPENPETQCIQESSAGSSTTYTNLNFTWVTIDTGISILDVGADILPDCVNDIWADYNQNTSSIVSILPPVLDIIGYTDIKIMFPYPVGWYFPWSTALIMPDELNPGNYFAGWYQDPEFYSFGLPIVGGVIVSKPTTIAGLWIGYEAAVLQPGGSKTYYTDFGGAAAAANGNVVEILRAPLANYTLKQTSADPVVYETLKVKRGHYLGECVEAPANLPQGYSLRTWTYQDSSQETITCYTVDTSYTVTFVYNNGAANTTQNVYSSQVCTKPTDPARADYSFTGWYSDAACTRSFDFTTPIHANTTLYAGWSANYTIAGTSLTLEGDIGVNFYVDLHGKSKQDVSMTLTRSGHDPETVSFASLEPIPAGRQGEGLYKVTVRVAAKELPDLISASLRHGETVVAEGTTSVESYALSVWRNEGGEYDTLFTGQNAAQQLSSLQALCRTMLIYGAKAQTLFRYETGTPADRGLDAADKALTPLEPAEIDGLGQLALDQDALAACGLKFYGLSLVLESETTIRAYFKVTDPSAYDGVQMQLKGKTLKSTPNGGYLYFDIANIAAKNVLNDYALSVVKNGASVCEMNFNAGAYVSAALAEGDEATQNAVTALYRYCKAAVCYFS